MLLGMNILFTYEIHVVVVVNQLHYDDDDRNWLKGFYWQQWENETRWNLVMFQFGPQDNGFKIACLVYLIKYKCKNIWTVKHISLTLTKQENTFFKSET